MGTSDLEENQPIYSKVLGQGTSEGWIERVTEQYIVKPKSN